VRHGRWLYQGAYLLTYFIIAIDFRTMSAVVRCIMQTEGDDAVLWQLYSHGCPYAEPFET
jgi:hypothetical protein